MVAITTRFGSGGANLVPGSAGGTPTLVDALRDVADDLAALAGWGTAAALVTESDVDEEYGVADGLIAGTPTTPSTQSADPGGETDWNINISAGYAFANSVGKYNAAQVDVNVSTGSKILDIGQSLYAWLVWAESGGTVTQVVVLGTAATDGAETIPSDGDITTGVGHARWCKIALLHGHRHADTTFQQTEDPSYMKKWGGAGADLANELKTRFNALVTAIDAVVLKTTKV